MKAGIFMLQMPENCFQNTESRELSQLVPKLLIERHSKDIDHLTVDEWIDTIISINNPIAITIYGDDDNSYRIYTLIMKNSKNICVGIDMKNLGHHVEIAKVKTAFARDIANVFNEILLFPSMSVLKKALEESSAAHNSQLYPQELVAKLKQIFIRAADFFKKNFLTLFRLTLMDFWYIVGILSR